MAVAVQEQRRQVEHAELTRQCLGMAGIDFKQRQVRMLRAIRREQLLPGAATPTTCTGEDHQREAVRAGECVVESELVERRERVYGVSQKYGFSLAFV